MRYFTILTAVILSILISTPCQAKWGWENQLISSPYHSHQILTSSLTFTWEASPNLAVTLGLPSQLVWNGGINDFTLSSPFLILTAQTDPQKQYSTSLRLGGGCYQGLSAEGTVKILADPLLIYYALIYQKQQIAVDAGAIFAANERWALGAHLRYSKNSLITYQLYRTLPKGVVELSYTHSLDGASQSLGLKIPF